MRIIRKSRFPVYSFIVLSFAVFLCVLVIIVSLRIGAGRYKTFYYHAEAGETLADVARKHSVPVETIASLNGLFRSSELYEGQALLIPRNAGTDVSSANLLREYCNFPKDVDERKWRYIVVHHGATDSGDANEYHFFHLEERGWRNGLGYDFVIGNGTGSPDGGITVGHRWARQIKGAHCTQNNMNRIGIGICLVGNFEKTRPTGKQMRSLTELVRYFRKRYGIPRENVLGHREAGASTDCPGKNLDMDKFRKSL